MGRTSSIAAMRRTREAQRAEVLRSPEEELLHQLTEERDKLNHHIEAVQKMIAERSRLGEQVEVIRELAERVMTDSEAKDDRISELSLELQARDGRISGLESNQSALGSRLQQLEATLNMLAEADEKLS